MPFRLPLLSEIVERTNADLTTNAGGSLRRSDQQVIARVHSGASHEMHGYLEWSAKQILPDSCDEDMLLRHGKLRLRVPRKDAVAATGSVRVRGAIDAVVDAGTLLQSDEQRQYVVTASVVLAETIADVSVRAFDTGTAGNIEGGSQLRFVSPVLGIAETATVLNPGITGGTNQESIERFRQRVIRSYRLVSDGGNADDYVTWALEVPGVTRAWCIRHYMGLGTVGVFIMRDDDLYPFPDEQARAAVHAYIETQRPVTAELYVLAPQARPIDFEIALAPDDSATRAAVTESLADLLLREGDLGVTVLESHLREAISRARGERDHKFYAPTGDIALRPNEIPVVGRITWR